MTRTNRLRQPVWPNGLAMCHQKLSRLARARETNESVRSPHSLGSERREVLTALSTRRQAREVEESCTNSLYRAEHPPRLAR